MNDRHIHILDLFSGIGGFALAAEIANAMADAGLFGQEEHEQQTTGIEQFRFRPLAHSEIEPFACAVYHRHFPDSVCLGPVQNVTRATLIERTGRGTAEIITGGFPCQPFSCAGKRQGDSDERHLWPWLAEAVCDVRPKFCLFENVRGLLTVQSSGRIPGGDYRRRRLYWDSKIKEQAQQLLLRHNPSGDNREGDANPSLAQDNVWWLDLQSKEAYRQMGGGLQLAYLRGRCGEYFEPNTPDPASENGASPDDFGVCGIDWEDAASTAEKSMDASNAGWSREVEATDHDAEQKGAASRDDADDGAASTGWVFGDILRDISAIGYACLWQVVPASAVGAPHRRDRVWLLCWDELDDAERNGLNASEVSRGSQSRNGAQGWKNESEQSQGSDCGCFGGKELADCKQPRLQGSTITGGTVDERQESRNEQLGGLRGTGTPWPAIAGHWPSRPGEPQYGWEPPRVVGNAAKVGCRSKHEHGELRVESGEDGLPRKYRGAGVDGAQERQTEPTLGIRPDGLPAAMGGDWPQVHNRVSQLKTAGNAILPECSAIFMYAIQKMLSN